MFGITTIQMPASADPGKNWLAFVHWLGKGLGVKVALPRKALGIPILDDKRLAHFTVLATDARLWFVQLDAPNMPATVTYRFVLFHRISVSVLDKPGLNCGVPATRITR